MPGFYNNAKYAQTSGAEGWPSNASTIGPWLRIDDASSIGWQVLVAGTSNPQGVLGMDVTDDEDAPSKADANLSPGVTAVVFSAAQTAQQPAGGGVAINYLFQFDPSPRAKWGRWKYTVTGGGSATVGSIKVGVSHWGGRA